MLANNGQQRAGRTTAWIGLWLAAGWLCGCASSPPPSPYRWTEFVTVRGHANPIPKQWVATPEGRFAHELVIPNPVPVDSGYQHGMSSLEYVLHLCKAEAGDFVFKTVDNIEGLYFARPPKAPSDHDLMDRWKLEHPYLESKFQSSDEPERRAIRFVSPPAANYRFYEEPNQDPKGAPYLRMSGYKDGYFDENFKRIPNVPWVIEAVNALKSHYGLIWRGIHRPFDRENGIAGGELIAYDIATNEVLAVFRNFAFSGGYKNTPDGIWWLTSGGCREVAKSSDDVFSGLRSRPQTVLKPIQ